MKKSCTIEIKGHIFDSLTLPKIMDTILDSGATYTIEDIQIGKEKTSISYAKLNITASDDAVMDRVLSKVTKQGASVVKEVNVTLGECIKDRTLPDNFYSTTNMPTSILLNNEWINVGNTAMDCAVVVDEINKRACCTKISQIKKGDKVVVGCRGILVHPIEKHLEEKLEDKSAFVFMDSEVSSEKPKSILIKKIAQRMAEIKENNEGKILFVLGPAVVHTKSQNFVSKLIEMGYMDYLFSGNALAVHDVEAALFGTSLGISQDNGSSIPGGHSHHLRAINRINHHGSIKNAVEAGELNSGIMYSCVKNNVDFVLAGSIRDDGPLPDVITDTITAQCEMRKRIKDAKMAIMVSSMLHSIAVGNLLPASIETICVDINPAVVTKLADRGTSQAIGLVTDVETFMKELVENLKREVHA